MTGFMNRTVYLFMYIFFGTRISERESGTGSYAQIACFADDADE